MKTIANALASTIALLAAALAPGALVPAVAQDAGPVAAESQQGQIVIPKDVTLFAQNDPNHRRATAVVNGDIVTGTDVDQRLALIVAANDNKLPPEEVARLKMQVLRNLIDETLQIQAAKIAEIEIDDAEVEQTYARVAQQNFGQNTKAMDAYLLRVGSSPASLKRQIRGELSWQRLLRRNVQPFVNVSDEEVREMMDRLKAAKGTEEFRIGEIYLSAAPEAKPAVLANAQRIVEQLRQGGSFRRLCPAIFRGLDRSRRRRSWLGAARTTARRAGDSGTRACARPAGRADRTARGLFGHLSDRQAPGADRRSARRPAGAQADLDQFRPGTNAADAQRKATEFADAMSKARGCGGVEAVAGPLGAQVVTNDQVKARDLPGPLQQALLNLAVGETSPPFGSVAEGVRVLMLCGRDDPKGANDPSFDTLMAQMEDDRVNKRAQMYLRDLRRDAVIDYN